MRPMRITSTLVLSAVLMHVVPRVAAGQTNEIGTPPSDRTMPGFAAMDSSIMSIENVEPLHTATLTTFSTLGNADLVPRDIGIEFVPMLFMSVHRPRTVWEGYRGLYNAGAALVPVQYLAFSIAFSQPSGLAATGERTSNVAIGVRTFLLAGRPNRQLQKALDTLVRTSQALDEEVQRTTDPPDREAAAKRAADLYMESQAARADLARASKNRVGYLLEVGAAAVATVRDNVISQGDVQRQSVWATLIRRLDRQDVAWGGIVRGTARRPGEPSVLDTGGRVTWTPARASITLTLEALGRRHFYQVPPADDDYWSARVVGGVSRSVGKSAQLSFGFGKNFSDAFTGGGTLAASFALKLGLGDLPVSPTP